ncbi:MAG: hypothetical protein IJX76_05120 [Clostridia bacterium]|nr:hypothetical protein [Clostridia bacterium]
MSNVGIIVGDDLVLSSGLTSPIWVEIDGCTFPDEDWVDFSHTLLCRWTDALLSYTGSAPGIRFGFMDGPYEIVIHGNINEPLTLCCMREDKCLLKGECTRRDLADALYRALKRMGYLLHESGLDEGNSGWMAEEIRARTARLLELI